MIFRLVMVFPRDSYLAVWGFLHVRRAWLGAHAKSPEKDCLLIHGSTVGCNDTLTPETSPITMLNRFLCSDANTIFCGRSGLAFQYHLPAAQVTSTVQTLTAASGTAVTAPSLPKQHTLNARQVVGVGNVGRIAGHASYTLYNPYANTVQFKQVAYGRHINAGSSSRGKGFTRY